MAAKFLVLLALLFASVSDAIYSREDVNGMVDYLQSIPIGHEANRLKIKDFFVLANKKIPEAYESYTGESRVVEDHEIETEVDSATFRSYSAAAEMVETGVSLAATPSLPSHTGLSASCSDKLCNMMEYLMSCKAIGLGVKKICAQYLFGSFYGCSQFPSYTDSIYDAPSICLKEYITVFAELITGVTGMSDDLQTTIADYLLKNYTTNACDRRCYQYYQNYSNEFYYSCQNQVLKYNKSYPFPALLTNFQQFRNQGCGYNPTNNESCYVKISTTFAGIQIANKTTHKGQVPDIMTNYYCDYSGMNNSMYSPVLAQTNTMILQGACMQLNAMGCCAGSGIALMQLNQIEATKGKYNIVPPCLLNFVQHSHTCPRVHLNQFCTKGTIATQTSFQGWFVVAKAPNFANAQMYPSAYIQGSLLQTQGVLATLFGQFGLSGLPYYMGKSSAFQIYITGYAYSQTNSTTGVTTQLTPTNGSTYWPFGDDYKYSTSGNFSYQVVLQNLNASQAQHLVGVVTNPMWNQALMKAFGSPTASSGILSYPKVFDAEPIAVASSGFHRSVPCFVPLVLAFIVVKLQLIFQ